MTSGNGQLLFANMTLYAQDGLQLVMMERFETLTSAVDCKGDDGEMSLTFKSQDAFDYALRTWSIINQNEDDRFLLIANHAGCGPDDERQPYIISKVTEDQQHLTTLLAAKPATWADVASDYDVDFGQRSHPKLRRRGWLSDTWEDVKDGVTGVVVDVKDGISDAVKGDFGFTQGGTFPVKLGQPNQPSNIYTDKEGHFKLDCVNCFVQGSFQVTGHLSVKGWKPQDLTLQATPQGFNAQLGLEATVTASTSIGSQKTLFSAPIPDAGISVSGLFTLGASVEWNVGFNAAFSGTGKFDFGVKANLPDSAKAILNIVGDTESSATGFQGAVDPYFDVKEITASAKLDVFTEPRILFGIKITKVGKADVAIGVKLPELTATLTAGYKSEGFCPNDAKHTTTGVDLTLTAGIAVNAEVDAAWGADADNKLPKWSKTLFNPTWTLPQHPCFPIAIPGLGSKISSVTEIPTLANSIIYSTSAGINIESLISVPTAKPVISASSALYVQSKPISDNGTPLSSIPTGSVPSQLSKGRISPSGILSSGVLLSGQLPSGALPKTIPASGRYPSRVPPSGTLPSGPPSKQLPSGTLPSRISPSEIRASGIPSNGIPSHGLNLNGLRPSRLPSGASLSQTSAPFPLKTITTSNSKTKASKTGSLTTVSGKPTSRPTEGIFTMHRYRSVQKR